MAQDLIKSPHVRTSLTNSQYKSFLRCEGDPLYFMNTYMKVQYPVIGTMPFTAYPFQERLIKTFHDNRLSIGMIPRQSGKCCNINTLVTIKDSRTGIIESITMGELYGRYNASNLSIMQYCNEGITFTPQSKTSNNSRTIQETVSKLSDTVQRNITKTIRKNEGQQKSRISAWRDSFSFFKEIFTWRYHSNNLCQGDSNSKNIWKQLNVHRTIFENYQWQFGTGHAAPIRPSTNLQFGKMYQETWRNRRSIEMGSSSKKMADYSQQQNTRREERNKQEKESTNRQNFQSRKRNSTDSYRIWSRCENSAQIKSSNNTSFLLRYLFWKENYRISWRFLACESKNLYNWAYSKISKWKNNVGGRSLATRFNKISNGNRPRLSDISGLGKRLQNQSKESYSRVHALSNSVNRKFINSIKISDLLILSDSGWQPITHIHQTIPYEKWILTTRNKTLECADDHIVFSKGMKEVFIKDLNVGDTILTDIGEEIVTSVIKTQLVENMYDITVSSNDHRLYTNGILSHNTTCAAGYLLWYAMFNSEVTILIAANKFRAASEIMSRVKFAYEETPTHIKAGVEAYNAQSIVFDNKSRILAYTTTPDSGRGMSLSLLYLDEFAFVKPRIAEEFWTAMSPTLSTGGKCIITSTPNSDEDKFAEIWNGATKTVDEQGNEIPNGLGINGFKSFTANYAEVPGRDEEWAAQEMAKIGVDKFDREYGCIVGTSMINIKLQTGKELYIPIKDLYKYL